jgi:hypothetical protein
MPEVLANEKAPDDESSDWEPSNHGGDEIDDSDDDEDMGTQLANATGKGKKAAAAKKKS